MVDLGQAFWQFVVALAAVVSHLLQGWWLLIVWVAWWLLAVNWPKTWRVLARGAWLPVVLIVVMGAITLSQVFPRAYSIPGAIVIPNFWLQLLELSCLVAVTFFCGWLQGVFGWTPAELDLNPPAPAGGHAHH